MNSVAWSIVAVSLAFAGAVAVFFGGACLDTNEDYDSPASAKALAALGVLFILAGLIISNGAGV